MRKPRLKALNMKHMTDGGEHPDLEAEEPYLVKEANGELCVLTGEEIKQYILIKGLLWCKQIWCIEV